MGVSGVATHPNGQSYNIKCSTTDVLSHGDTLIYKGVSTIEATEAAASVIFANSYMYSQLSTPHRVDYNTYSATLTWFSVHSE